MEEPPSTLKLAPSRKYVASRMAQIAGSRCELSILSAEEVIDVYHLYCDKALTETTLAIFLRDAVLRRFATVPVRVALVLLAVWPAVASAQTVPAPQVNPTRVEFVCSPDHNLQEPAGVPIVTGYSIEIWQPGTDTIQGIPALGTGEIGKNQFTVTGSTCVMNFTSIPGWNDSFTIPKGQTWVMTVTTRGPAGSARSPISNSFTYPLPTTPVPRPVVGVTVK